MDIYPKVVIIAGPNGAGKTTSARLLLKERFGVLDYVNADAIAHGLSAFQPETMALEAGRVMLNRLHSLAARQRDFAFETTLAGRSYAPWLKEICQQGYQLHLLFLWLNDPALAVARVRKRVEEGGHGIPEATIRRRYRNGVRNFFAFYQPLATTWGVYHNSETVGPVLIAQGQHETVMTIRQPDLWRAFGEVAK
jgi:predicted ABC-type ATPase